MCSSGLHNSKRYIKALESIQRKVTKLNRGQEDMSGEERLKTLGLLRLQTTLQREKAERND